MLFDKANFEKNKKKTFSAFFVISEWRNERATATR